MKYEVVTFVNNEIKLDVNQVVAKNATTGNDGKTYIVSFYNLDVIIPLYVCL